MRLHNWLIHDTKCSHVSVDLGATFTVVAEALDKERKGKDLSTSLSKVYHMEDELDPCF